MACTNALSVFWCGAPDLPGLTNSRKTTSTLGGGVTPSAPACATTVAAPPASKATINHNPMYRFMPQSLLSLRVLLNKSKSHYASLRSHPPGGPDWAPNSDSFAEHQYTNANARCWRTWRVIGIRGPDRRKSRGGGSLKRNAI